MLLSELIQAFQLTPQPAPKDDPVIRGIRPLADAGPGDLSFLANPKYRDQLVATGASAVLVRTYEPLAKVQQLVCADPYVMLAHILQRMFPEPHPSAGIHPSAVVDPTAQIGSGVTIGPFCSVGPRTLLGDGSILTDHVSIAEDCRLGEHCKLFPGVVLYARSLLGDRVRIHANSVIGSDGFGYAQHQGKHVKIPQIGAVVIGDDVEIGSQVAIDRGALADTVIGAGTKIDNQVQVAHNVVVGEHALLISQTGISGSAKVGNHAILAGKVGVTGHVSIGDHILVMGDSVVTKDLTKPGRYAGNPAIPHMKYQRQQAHTRRLSEYIQRIQRLESKTEE